MYIDWKFVLGMISLKDHDQNQEIFYNLPLHYKSLTKSFKLYANNYLYKLNVRYEK